MRQQRQADRSERSDVPAASLAGAAPRSERQPGLRAIGATTARLVGPIVARRGGGALHRLKADWAAIAGPDLAAIAWPEALSATGALRLRVAPGHALGLQHRAPLVIERINGFFGRGVVARIGLIQGPLPLRAPAAPAAAEPIPTETAAALDRRVAAVADPELRAALAALGRAVLSAARSDG